MASAGPGPRRQPHSAARDVQEALRRAIERASAGRAPPQLPEIPEKVRFELRRKVLHVLTAIVAVPFVMLIPYPWSIVIAGLGILVISVTWGIERRRLPPELKGPLHEEMATILEKTRRPHEDFPWSPVLYTASLILIALAHEHFGMSWSLAFAAYAILGIGDAASALVGVAYGRTKLPWNPKKSLEGTTAGFVAGFLAGVLMAVVPFAFTGLVIPPPFIFVVAAGAASGALAETVPHVEDNFVVPLTAAGVMFALTTWLAIPLP